MSVLPTSSMFLVNNLPSTSINDYLLFYQKWGLIIDLMSIDVYGTTVFDIAHI